MKAQDRERCDDGLIALAGQFLLALFSKPKGRTIARIIPETEEIAKKSLRSAK
jgi:hypothetical protein